MKLISPAIALILVGALAACDNSDDEARIEELETQLAAAESEAEELQGQVAETESLTAETEQLKTDLEEANARVEELESRPAGSAEPSFDPSALRQPMTDAIAMLRETDQQLERLANTLADEGYEDLEMGTPRDQLQAAAKSIADAAEAAGLDPQSLQPK